ncbi:cytokine receptor common subunit beta-like [Rhinatrema bivittatum]|uniref:cytokine receptor common subunit beta-like n=1 Tax=Rhinatrema bivittatum TaxID=194408 RepID=UPI001129ADE8|nr:cytokine receptor common subunit beta-like [Rhinatrema bivittatum]
MLLEGREKQKDTKELSPGCQQINITTGTKELFLNLKSQLEPETRYAVKVRAHSQIGNPNSCYNGPWSEWSEEYQWQTDLEILAQDLLLLSLIPVGIILLFICAPFGYRYLKRAKRNWEDTIPNPGKSKLFITYLQRGYLMIPQLLAVQICSNPVFGERGLMQLPSSAGREGK